jgi:DNA-binding CsgD family transcriptional regulator
MEFAASPSRYRLRYGSREIAVPTGELTIGRAPDCDLQLSGGLVSRKHALLTCTPDHLVVRDLGSRNGVLVNHRKITEPTHLAHADVLGIGVETLEVIDEHVLQHPAHLSTLPPPGAGSPSPAPLGEADVDAPAQLTMSARLDILSEREREVLELIVLGHTQREIAQRLFVSVKTIETHRARVVEKLGCHTRAELVTYAITAGLLASALQPRPPGKP